MCIYVFGKKKRDGVLVKRSKTIEFIVTEMPAFIGNTNAVAHTLCTLGEPGLVTSTPHAADTSGRRSLSREWTACFVEIYRATYFLLPSSLVAHRNRENPTRFNEISLRSVLKTKYTHVYIYTHTHTYHIRMDVCAAFVAVELPHVFTRGRRRGVFFPRQDREHLLLSCCNSSSWRTLTSSLHVFDRLLLLPGFIS